MHSAGTRATGDGVAAGDLAESLHSRWHSAHATPTGGAAIWHCACIHPASGATLRSDQTAAGAMRGWEPMVGDEWFEDPTRLLRGNLLVDDTARQAITTAAELIWDDLLERLIRLVRRGPDHSERIQSTGAQAHITESTIAETEVDVRKQSMDAAKVLRAGARDMSRSGVSSMTRHR